MIVPLSAAATAAPPLFGDLLLLFACAVPAVWACHRVGLPAVLAFLAVGVVVGPAGLGWIAAAGEIDALAEIGVVVLLFGVGVELSLERVRRLWRQVLIGGGLQVFVTAGVAAGLFLALGWSAPVAIFTGLLAALSSTALVLRLYTERGELESGHGRLAVGVLLFQDLLVVPLTLAVPLLAAWHGARPATDAEAPDVLRTLGIAVATLGTMWVLGGRLYPWILERTARTRHRELFTLTVILLVLGTAFLFHYLGLPLALGAFLAGLLVSESPVALHAFTETLPFRDAFNGLFFVSVGMLVPPLAETSPVLGELALLTVGAMVVKFAVMLGVGMVINRSLRTSVPAALGLCQLGEFGFVLVVFGLEAGLVDENVQKRFVTAAVASMAATPLLVAAAARMIPHLPTGRRMPVDPDDGVEDRATPQVVTVGHGLSGRHLAAVLHEIGIPHRGVDMDARKVAEARDRGEVVLWGDGTREEVLLHLGVPDARVIVVMVPDEDAARRIVQLSRRLNEDALLIVLTRHVHEIEPMQRLGASLVIPEEFETSIEVFVRVLSELRVPDNIIRAQAELVRSEGYGALRGMMPAADDAGVRRILTETATLTHMLGDDSPCVGETLQSIDLRERTGAAAIAVIRGEESHPAPGGDFRLEARDLVLLIGPHEALDRALRLLDGREDADGDGDDGGDDGDGT